jgi:hypothetical protein
MINKPKKEPAQTPIFEPFPQPQTMPDGWDLSVLLSESASPVVEHFKDLSTD